MSGGDCEEIVLSLSIGHSYWYHWYRMLGLSLYPKAVQYVDFNNIQELSIYVNDSVRKNIVFTSDSVRMNHVNSNDSVRMNHINKNECEEEPC